MARHCSENQESGEVSDGLRVDEEGEEDEALSLCDLPLNFINEATSSVLQEAGKEATTTAVAGDTQGKEIEEEFNFDSWGGSMSAESEMCAADDIFFKGQMLPLRRLSVSSDSGLLARFQNDGDRNISRCISRSESMDRCITMRGGPASINSSRSSSTNSSNSSSFITANPRSKIRNHFHSFPSPNPQIRAANVRPLCNIGSSGSVRSQKLNSMWDFLRLGLVRAPEIELQDLKIRNNNSINSSGNRSSVSRNSSSGSSSTTHSSSSIRNNQQDRNIGKQQQQKKQSRSFLDKRKKGLFSGCRCSVSAVETVPLNNIVIIKSSSNSNQIVKGTVQDMKKQLQELNKKKKMEEKQQGKQAMSRHRTFEWLKELSHAKQQQPYVDANFLYK